MNSVLSIAIPTYNRAAFLDRTLAYHVPLLARFGVPIIIRDNASSDETESVVAKWQQVYPFIQYTRNDANVGPDKNFELALKDARTEYVWLLGDTYLINEEQIKFILERSALNAPDFFVFNTIGRVKDVPSATYSDCNRVLSEIGWHMTCMAALVYKKEHLSKLCFARYDNSNFLQLGIILEYIAFNPFRLMWVADLSVEGLVIPGVEKVSWLSQALYIWIERWTNFVCSLPVVYRMDSKLKAIGDHGKKSGLFTVKGLLILRAKNILKINGYLKNRRLFFGAVRVNFIMVFGILIIPSQMLGFVVRIYKNKFKSTKIESAC